VRDAGYRSDTRTSRGATGRHRPAAGRRIPAPYRSCSGDGLPGVLPAVVLPRVAVPADELGPVLGVAGDGRLAEGVDRCQRTTGGPVVQWRVRGHRRQDRIAPRPVPQPGDPTSDPPGRMAVEPCTPVVGDGRSSLPRVRLRPPRHAGPVPGVRLGNGRCDGRVNLRRRDFARGRVSPPPAGRRFSSIERKKSAAVPTRGETGTGDASGAARSPSVT